MQNATNLLGLTLREDIDRSHGIIKKEDKKRLQSEEKIKNSKIAAIVKSRNISTA